MARKPRVHANSGIYHIILRGNDQINLFLDTKDRHFFLNRLQKYSSELNIHIYTYCLMSNHVHILLGCDSKSLSKFVQKIANSYVYYFNRKYERSGHLFQGRFKSEPVETDEYFKTVLRYILQNPESAMIEKMELYEWSSYKYFLEQNDCKSIDTAYVCNIFQGKSNLLQFLSLRSTEKCMEFQNKKVINDERGLSIIKQLFKLHSPFELNRRPPEEQSLKISLLKQKGLSNNQIMRLTGINRIFIKSVSK